jgi:NADH-quinone oxidoreductase subunit J
VSDPGWGTIGFYAFAALAVIPGFGILLTRNIVHAAFWLLAALLGVSGLYMVLGADFLAFTQLLVYIGGILVLILFGVMLTHKDPVRVRRTRHWGNIGPALLVFTLVLITMAFVIFKTTWDGQEWQPEPTTEGIGTLFMTEFILPFEIVSVLILAALIGAVYIARGKEVSEK